MKIYLVHIVTLVHRHSHLQVLTSLSRSDRSESSEATDIGKVAKA